MVFKPEITHRWFPVDRVISEHSVKLENYWIYKLGNDDNVHITDFGLEEKGAVAKWDVTFNNNDRLNIEVAYQDLTLLEDFDPTRVQEDDIFLLAGNRYINYFFSSQIRTDQRKIFSYTIKPFIGKFFEGLRTGIEGSVTYRYQPYGSVSVNVNYNHIRLDMPYETTNLWLIGPRIDFTFSKKVFLTTFIQYNNQLDNLNINSRFQWRFAPVSDFFLVYTDNFSTDPFDQYTSRNRALVAKLTYWLNL